MNTELIRFILTCFVTLMVVVEPFSVVPIFNSLTREMEQPRRRSILARAVGIALGVAFFFLIAGRATLAYLGVTVYAFSISGGVLLFMTALPMLFGHRGGMQSPDREESEEARGDIAVFPLATPLLSGPGAIASILLLTQRAHSAPLYIAALAVAMALVYAICWTVLSLGRQIMRLIGDSGSHVVTRVMGMVLAALAVQFVLDGVTAYSHTLSPPAPRQRLWSSPEPHPITNAHHNP